MSSKKAIEPVVATVLLIVITIAVVGLVVAFLLPYISSITDRQTACKDVILEIDSTGTCTNDTGTWVMVELSGLGDYSLSKIVVQATAGGTTKTQSIVTSLPTLGGANTYTFQDVSNAMKVGAIPWVKYKNKEYSCDNGKAELLSVPTC